MHSYDQLQQNKFVNSSKYKTGNFGNSVMADVQGRCCNYSMPCGQKQIQKALSQAQYAEQLRRQNYAQNGSQNYVQRKNSGF